MSWTVPQGCYYAYYSTNTGIAYYGAGQTVPNGQEPTDKYSVLVDFTNGYIYAGCKNCTITMGSNNTFTWSWTSLSYVPSSFGIIASDDCLDYRDITLAGSSFTFGDGTGLLPRSALSLSSNLIYDGSVAFSERNDISVAKFPTGLESAFCMYKNCTSLVSSDQIPNSVRSVEMCFYNTAIVTAPAIPSSVANMAQCFRGCKALTTPPDMSNASAVTDMHQCFYECNKMATAPTIPSSVRTIYQCFYHCSSMTTPPPSIPSGVTNMSQCFTGCTRLTTAPTLPSTVTNMNSCFANCSALTTAPELNSGITDMYQCFNACSSLTTAPAIPASVTKLGRCFNYCSSLEGNITVYTSAVSQYASIFSATSKDIYIINGAGTSAVETLWKTIISDYSNVHYEADDNPVPTLSFTVTRVGGMASETPAENGEYAFIKATAVIYDTLIPDGWAAEYDEDESTTKDGTTATPYWTRTNVGNTYTLKCWFSLNDTTKHTFTLQVSDSVIDQYDNVKATKLSTIITQVLPKAYKLVDYYHDPDTDTEGMSIGKFATDANLLDVDMPALFRDTATMGEAIIDEPYFSLDTTAQSGTDHDLYAAITALGWQNDVIV